MAIVKEYNLILTDIIKNNNKFWYGYFLDDGTGYSEWGRVGQTGTRTNYPSHKIIEKKYLEKLKKGYEPLKIIKNTTNLVKNVNNLKTVAKQQIKKTDNILLDNLIDRLVKFNIHNITANTSIQYDINTKTFSTPLGLIDQDGIDEARDLLVKIHKLLTDKKTDEADIISYTNKYTRIIPQDIGFRKLKVHTIFPNITAIKNQNDILDSLEISLKDTIKPTQKTTIEEKIFNVTLDYLDPQDSEYIRLSKYYNSTNRSVHGYKNVKIQNIYKINIQSNIDNFKLLKPIVEVFHGTSGANCLSILKSGLRAIPPKSAAICGALFGSGVYGAIDSSKSLQYTTGRFGGKNTEFYYMFICDFSMGNYYEIGSYGGTKPKGYDSIWAKASKAKLRFDELIVPDNQVKIKYLLELK